MNDDNSQLHLQMGQETIYLLLTFSLFGLVVALTYLLEPANPNLDQKTDLTSLLSGKQAEIEQAKERIRSLEQEIASQPTNDQPPIIVLKESDGFLFAPGSSEISPEFQKRVREEVLPKLVNLSKTYAANIVEVIGHTDGVPVGAAMRVGTNLDAALPAFALGNSTTALIPYDNAGLGLARALAMSGALVESGLPESITVLPMSAGSLIGTDDSLSPSGPKDNNLARRRIEIRIRRRRE